MKYRFYPLRDDVAAGILTQTGHKAVVAEFLTLEAAKALRERQTRRLVA